MKKALIALLASSMLLCGCSNKESESENINESIKSETTSIVETVDTKAITTEPKKEFPNYFELNFDSVKKEYPNTDLELEKQMLIYESDNSYGFKLYNYDCKTTYIFHNDGSFETVAYYVECDNDLELIYDDIKEKLIEEYGSKYEKRTIDNIEVIEWNVIPNIEILFSQSIYESNQITLFISEDTSAQDALDEVKKEKENKSTVTTITTTKTVEAPIQIKFVSKDVVYEDIDNWIFSDYILFEFEIINKSDKDIKGISGLATFNDMFGKEILTVHCDFTNGVNANSSVFDNDHSLDVNQFMDNHLKLRDTPYEDMFFEYVPEKIVYSDGTIEEY